MNGGNYSLGLNYTDPSSGYSCFSYPFLQQIYVGLVEQGNDFGQIEATVVEPTYCGYNNGRITVTAPLGAIYEYRLNAGNWQSNPTIYWTTEQ
ncbi:MAG: hypothetical protein HC821_02210 [Lewinella sp.]|nr:hypothetical protein [Lewinella sp.]